MLRGEALTLDTPILTTSGYKTMGTVNVGDKVFDENGETCNIIAKSEIFEDRPTYKITFNDDSVIYADENHKWEVKDRKTRMKKRYLNKTEPSIKRTKELIENVKVYGNTNFSVDKTKPLKLQEKKVPVHPYILGYWLGDGRVRGTDFTTADQEVIDYMKKLGYDISNHNSKYHYRILNSMDEFRELDILNNKHIPDIYLFNSYEKRQQLLRGLMDSDGTITKEGKCSFANTNLKLIKQVQQLVAMQGHKPRKLRSRKKEEMYKTNYRFSFTPKGDEVIFNIPRKQDRVRNSTVTNDYRLITSIEKVEPQKTQCIQVDSPSSLFLAGRNLIPTHNSGLLNIYPEEESPRYKPSKRRVEFTDGSQAFLYSSEKPERLRGPQHHLAWCDEMGAWGGGNPKVARNTWDMLQMGLRLGQHPQSIVTTTPKPMELIIELVEDDNCFVTRGSTYDNMSNLPNSFVNSILKKYEGTRLGKQELDAELLLEVPDALWDTTMLDENRVTITDVPTMKRVIVAVDPAVSNNEDSDETGIVVVGRGQDDEGYILADYSIKSKTNIWAKKVSDAYHAEKADLVVGEVNNGGDLVESVLKTVDKNMNYESVRASRGKAIRAEPISGLYEQGRIHHIGEFEELEKQMCKWSPKDSNTSPDRMDALVWGLTELFVNEDQASSLVTMLQGGGF